MPSFTWDRRSRATWGRWAAALPAPWRSTTGTHPSAPNKSKELTPEIHCLTPALLGKRARVDLNTLIDPKSGWVLEVATAINNSGQIVGFGYINGMERGFLLSQAPVINAQKAGRARPAVHGVRFGRAARHQR